MRVGLLAGGGLLAAVAASTCCVLPLSLGAAGVGSAWLSTLAALAAYETVFRLLAIVLLGAGFWFVYAAGRPAASNAVACSTSPSHRTTKTLLWTGAIVMALVLSSGWWGRLIV